MAGDIYGDCGYDRGAGHDGCTDAGERVQRRNIGSVLEQEQITHSCGDMGSITRAEAAKVHLIKLHIYIV